MTDTAEVDLICPLCRELSRGRIGAVCRYHERDVHMHPIAAGQRAAIEANRRARGAADYEQEHDVIPRGF